MMNELKVTCTFPAGLLTSNLPDEKISPLQFHTYIFIKAVLKTTSDCSMHIDQFICMLKVVFSLSFVLNRRP